MVVIIRYIFPGTEKEAHETPRPAPRAEPTPSAPEEPKEPETLRA